MAMNMTSQVRNIAEVAKAVASGDLTKTIEVDARGELFDLNKTVNEMTESLSDFAEEVTRVVREAGMEGLLGHRANVTNVNGAWKVRPRACLFRKLFSTEVMPFFLTPGLDGLCERDGS